MATPKIVSGVVSTVTDLGKDEAWMQGWLQDQPDRLGLGELEIADSAADDGRSFVAIDEDRCFSVEVQLGEMEAARGFQVLDNWARNRVRHPDKTHVAVLVTESVSDRYQTTLRTLAEHLPLVVVELQVWKGDAEAIVVPHVALASDDVDLSTTPAGRAAEAMARTAAAAVEASEPESEAESTQEPVEVTADGDPSTQTPAVDAPENKDDTGVSDPWGLPQADADAESPDSDSSSGHRLLSKVS